MPHAHSSPAAHAQMVIRQPVEDVFNAFIDPDVLTKFWLSGASAPLSVGAHVHWDFMVSGSSEEVEVEAGEPQERIRIRWSDGTTAEWRITPFEEGQTMVAVEQAGFDADAEATAKTVGATEGFSIVPCDLKTLLETGTSAGLVRDKAALIEPNMDWS